MSDKVGKSSKGVMKLRYEQTLAMAQMHNDGMSYEKIGAHFQIDHKSVWKRVNKLNKGLYVRQPFTKS
jgi:hypothetical protein